MGAIVFCLIVATVISVIYDYRDVLAKHLWDDTNRRG